MRYMDADKTYREQARPELHKNAWSIIERIQVATYRKTPALRPNSLSDKQDIWDTAGETRKNS